jgi:hypothetical protein
MLHMIFVERVSYRLAGIMNLAGIIDLAQFSLILNFEDRQIYGLRKIIY